jgi:hypothetical protein
MIQLAVFFFFCLFVFALFPTLARVYFKIGSWGCSVSTSINKEIIYD